MRVDDHPRLHLTYCLNVHPGESWAENFAAIRDHTARVRDRVARGRPFGLGLRLSRRAADELAAPAALDDFRRFLNEAGMYVFTVNAFPYGAFHGTPVKQDVYRPDWRSAERRDYTVAVADVLARLLPEGVGGSISTVPVSYRAWIDSAADVRQAGKMLADTAVHLADILDRTGRDICLALEPEPDCWIENTDETIAFFADLPPAVRRHLGVCFDTAHLAVQFEDLAGALGRLRDAGIRVAKVHLSSALQARPTPDARRRLAEFRDRVYLHQVRSRRPDGRIVSYPDLDDALDAPGGEEDLWRVHFHVPLFFDRDGPLESTTGLFTSDFVQMIREGIAEHLEIETYTFGVLPEFMKVADVTEGIAREYAWVLGRFFPRRPGGP